MSNRNEEFENGRSQDDFDKEFNKIVVNQAAHDRLAAHASSFSDIKPIQTAASFTCNSCDEDHEQNAVYHPGNNSIHYICPETGESESESNWFDYGTDGNMVNPWNGSKVTPENLHEHLSAPMANKPSITWKKWLNNDKPKG